MLKFTVLLVLMSVSGLSFSAPGPEVFEIMTWNVENLFDNTHDEHHLDWEYTEFGTPGKVEGCQSFDVNYFVKRCLRTNWSDYHVESKLDAIAKVVRREGRRLPRVLALQEVENQNIVGQLARKLGYKSFEITTGLDGRGINVALLYNESDNFKFLGKLEHSIDTRELRKPTRNILEVQFIVGGKFTLSVFVNHWPSQSNPVSDRLKAAESLSKVISGYSNNNPQEHYYVVVGDFNVNGQDYPNPVSKYFVNASTVPFYDAEQEFRKSPVISEVVKNKIPKGSYFYKRDGIWNKLDKILVDTRLFDRRGPEIVLSKFDIYAHPEMLRVYSVIPGLELPEDQLIPQRFEETSNGFVGASDHFPMSLFFKF